LLANGDANVTAWPGTNAIGTGAKFGSWGRALAGDLRVSDRSNAAGADIAIRADRGFRGLRSAGCTFSARAPTFDTANGLSPNVAAIGSTLVYKVNETGNFIWIIPAGWEIVSGQGTNQIELQINTLPGTIRVGAVNDCGASSLTALIIN
jgi:hypothetical protein